MANFPNLFQNAGFEHGDIADWFSSSSAVSASTADHHTGSYCGAGTAWGDLQQQVDCWSSTNYIVSCWIKGLIGGISANFQIQDTGGTNFSVSPAYTITGAWTQMTYTFNTGAHTQINIDFALTAYSGSGISFYVDDFQIYPAAVVGTTWSPGSNPWTLIFSDDFLDDSTIDKTASNADGFHWYPQMFYGLGTNPATDWSVTGGALIINNSNTNFSDTLHTARPGPGGVGYLGTVFNGGAGAYFEIRTRFLNYSSISTSGWPSFWLDSQALGYKPTPGNPGLGEAMELDILEFFPSVWTGGDTSRSDFTVHDWFTGMGSSQIGVGAHSWYPVGTNPFTTYHTYGMVWFPATSANGWIGYVQVFFDGNPGPSWIWKGNQIYSGVIPPTADSTIGPGYLLSQLDSQWLMLIVGSSQGGTPTMDIDYVKVWAANPAGSMKVVTTAPPVVVPIGSLITPGGAQGLTGP
jgi:hypothetical protein